MSDSNRESVLSSGLANKRKSRWHLDKLVCFRCGKEIDVAFRILRQIL